MTVGLDPENQQNINDLVKENKSLKRQLRNLDSILKRNKAMLAARTTIGSMLESERTRMERNMSLMLDNSMDIILLFDRDGHFTYFTSSFLKATGIVIPAILRGRHFSEVFSRLTTNEWTDFMHMNYILAMEQRSTITIGTSIDLSGGNNPKDYDIQITPMIDKDGHLEAAMMLFHDNTDTLRAKRHAESASLAKSQFLATMSHEMRTPMNAVLGMTSIGKAASDKSRMLYCFQRIEDASHHLLGVINDILDMSKIEANKFDLSLADFNFERMIQKVVNVVNFRINEKKQKLSVHIDEVIPRVMSGDDQRLAQVVTNILGNAAKFTSDYGSITLDARLLIEVDDVCTILITVTDTGIGISPEQQNRLFKSFQQAESDTTRKFGGTGLGLSISKRIVEMMDGEIDVESELGKGTVVSFTVKLKKVRGQTLNPVSYSNRWKGARILAIDKDSDALAILKSTTRKYGMICDTAESVEDTFRAIEKNGAYDIYIINLIMPDTNGIELAKTLRAKRVVSGNSVIIMSSDSEWMAVEEDAKSSGFEMFISKPIFASPLFDVLNECMKSNPTYEIVKDVGSLGGYGVPDDFDIWEDYVHPDMSRDVVNNYIGHCVLLAEDVKINQEIVIALLEPTQIEIDCAENGSEAISMFCKSPEKYDMIFMDVQMPEMDGYEATQRIRALDHPRAQAIPIIALTANVFRDDVKKCLDIGMNGHIGKPLDFDEVLQCLRRYLTN